MLYFGCLRKSEVEDQGRHIKYVAFIRETPLKAISIQVKLVAYLLYLVI